MTKVNSKYVPIHNDSITINNDNNIRHLLPHEIYLYVHLSLYVRAYDKLVYVNVDLLHQSLPYKFDDSNESRNKKQIKTILIKLKGLNYISFDNDEFKNNTLLLIEFPKVDNGFERVSLDDVKDKSPYDLYAYLVCYRWRKSKTKTKMSYSNWALHFGVSDKTALTLINGMCERNIIYRKSGAFNSQGKQEVNIYDTKPFVIEEKKEFVHVEEEKENNNQVNEIDQVIINNYNGEEYTIQEIKKLINISNWGKKKDNGKYSKIEFEDYILYRICKDNSVMNKFVKNCDRVIKFTNEKFDNSYFVDYEIDYDVKVKYRKQKEQEEEVNRVIGAIINNTNNIVLVVDGKNVPYTEYQGGKIEKMYYKFGHFYISEFDDYSYEIRSIDNPSQIQIDHYKPDINGEWKNIYDIDPEQEDVYIPEF